MSTAPMNVEPWTVAENLIVASPVSAILHVMARTG